jgi:lipid-binding SYLF domain-containing protein
MAVFDHRLQRRKMFFVGEIAGGTEKTGLGGNVTLGGNLSAAAGPVGRTAEGSVALQAAMYSYSISQGLFAGISFEGTVIATPDEANAEYYGKPVAAKDILAGKVKPPAGEQKLLQVLSKY